MNFVNITVCSLMVAAMYFYVVVS